jgi:hypothetical protein
MTSESCCVHCVSWVHLTTLCVSPWQVILLRSNHHVWRWRVSRKISVSEYLLNNILDFSLQGITMWRACAWISFRLLCNGMQIIDELQIKKVAHVLSTVIWVANQINCRSQWPRGLRHEMSSPAWTLGSWVRIPLEAWMFVCVYSVFVLSCVSSGLATGWSLVQGVLPTLYKCKITEPHKEEAKVRHGLQRHIRRRIRIKSLAVGTGKIKRVSCWSVSPEVMSRRNPVLSLGWYNLKNFEQKIHLKLRWKPVSRLLYVILRVIIIGITTYGEPTNVGCTGALQTLLWVYVGHGIIRIWYWCYRLNRLCSRARVEIMVEKCYQFSGIFSKISFKIEEKNWTIFSRNARSFLHISRWILLKTW